MKEAVFAVPGELATPTGGYVYDRRIIEGLAALGWRIAVVDLGDGFPFPATDTRAAAGARLAALPIGPPIVIDGLAFGALPDAAEALRATHALVALVHHPLALEIGIERDGISRVARERMHGTRLCAACDHHEPGDRAAACRRLRRSLRAAERRGARNRARRDRGRARSESVIALLSVGAVVPRKGYDVLVAALAKLKHLPWRLVIAGDCERSPETFRRLVADIASLGLTDRDHIGRDRDRRAACVALRIGRPVRAAFALRGLWDGLRRSHRPWRAGRRHQRRRHSGDGSRRRRRAGAARRRRGAGGDTAAAHRKSRASASVSPRARAPRAFPSWSGQAALFARALASLR